MSPGLSSCCSFPELSQISFLEPLASSLTPIRRPAPSASSPPPPPLTPLLLAAPQCWMCLLFLQLLLCPRSFATQASTCTYTHIHTLAHSYMYVYKQAHMCPSYHPSSLSLHVRKTGKPLWYSLVWFWVRSPFTNSWNTVWFSFAVLTTVSIKYFPGQMSI